MMKAPIETFIATNTGKEITVTAPEIVCQFTVGSVQASADLGSLKPGDPVRAVWVNHSGEFHGWILEPSERFHPNIRHFLQLAFRGKSGVASGGEYIAAKLARKISTIGDELMSLDASAQAGFLELVKFAADPDNRENVLKLLKGKGNGSR